MSRISWLPQPLRPWQSVLSIVISHESVVSQSWVSKVNRVGCVRTWKKNVCHVCRPLMLVTGEVCKGMWEGVWKGMWEVGWKGMCKGMWNSMWMGMWEGVWECVRGVCEKEWVVFCEEGLPVMVTVVSVIPIHRDNTYATSETVSTIFIPLLLCWPCWFPLVLALATGPGLGPVEEEDKDMTMPSNTSRCDTTPRPASCNRPNLACVKNKDNFSPFCNEAVSQESSVSDMSSCSRTASSAVDAPAANNRSNVQTLYMYLQRRSALSRIRNSSPNSPINSARVRMSKSALIPPYNPVALSIWFPCPCPCPCPSPSPSPCASEFWDPEEGSFWKDAWW